MSIQGDLCGTYVGLLWQKRSQRGTIGHRGTIARWAEEVTRPRHRPRSGLTLPPPKCGRRTESHAGHFPDSSRRDSAPRLWLAEADHVTDHRWAAAGTVLQPDAAAGPQLVRRPGLGGWCPYVLRGTQQETEVTQGRHWPSKVTRGHLQGRLRWDRKGNRRKFVSDGEVTT